MGWGSNLKKNVYRLPSKHATNLFTSSATPSPDIPIPSKIIRIAPDAANPSGAPTPEPTPRIAQTKPRAYAPAPAVIIAK